MLANEPKGKVFSVNVWEGWPAAFKNLLAERNIDFEIVKLVGQDESKYLTSEIIDYMWWVTKEKRSHKLFDICEHLMQILAFDRKPRTFEKHEFNSV